MMTKIFLAFFFIVAIGNAQIRFSERRVELGMIPAASEISGAVTITNNSARKVFLMRADADRGVKVYTSKRTLLPGDTCLLVISFIPEKEGRFDKRINLVSSDRDTPSEIALGGNLAKLVSDDKTACYYFGTKRKNERPAGEMPAIVDRPEAARDNSNRLPDPHRNESSPVTGTNIGEPEAKAGKMLLPPDEFKPNNILFLVDVSGSMKDSLKLPLMKTALHTLIAAVRDIDRITFVTYADSVKVIREGVRGSDKTMLHEIVNGLRAKGLTKGNKAILYSQRVAQQHFIPGGNNQVLLATDGKFRFNDKDFRSWTEQQRDRPLILSTVAFGDDKEALGNLQDIARKCKGSFIHIKRMKGSENKLLDEIRDKSRIQ